MNNPHFDENIVIWKDEYSGRYQPPPAGYSMQFELQWKLALEDKDYYNYPGASVDDKDIEDRIYEWTGNHSMGKEYYDDSWGRASILNRPVDVDLIRGKDCIDIGCGLGRWTRVMLALGAKSVLSTDVSESGLSSVRKFNDNVMKVDVMEIPSKRPELTGAFDFANLWGVAMATHDPLQAFMNAASTVKPDGALYIVVYAPDGLHGKNIVNIQRKIFSKLSTLEQQLAYVEHVQKRIWDRQYPLLDNLYNLLRNILDRPYASKVGVLDMLETFYNWVIPLDVVYGWMDKAGFTNVQWLNEDTYKRTRAKTSYHLLGLNKK